jgi:transcriptional regulator with XRE-family HTH domain
LPSKTAVERSSGQAVSASSAHCYHFRIVPKTKKRPDQTATANKREITRIVVAATREFASQGDEPWCRYRVRPDVTGFAEDPPGDPERRVGARIAYCRKQLDNLSVEALSRYTKKFDRYGIARTTLVRYETGDFLPGARELRILADTFWVPITWLLLGIVENQSSAEKELLDALAVYMNERTGGGLPQSFRDEMKRSHAEQLALETAKRQRWLYEARKPGSKSA